jgi:hypothetical protein
VCLGHGLRLTFRQGRASSASLYLSAWLAINLPHAAAGFPATGSHTIQPTEVVKSPAHSRLLLPKGTLRAKFRPKN